VTTQQDRGLLGTVFDLCRIADVRGFLLCEEDREALEIIATRITTTEPTVESLKRLYGMLVRITPRLVGSDLELDLMELKHQIWLLRATTQSSQ